MPSTAPYVPGDYARRAIYDYHSNPHVACVWRRLSSPQADARWAAGATLLDEVHWEPTSTSPSTNTGDIELKDLGSGTTTSLSQVGVLKR